MKPDIISTLNHEISLRLFDHLEFVLLQPQTILQLEPQPEIDQLLQQRFSKAKRVTLASTEQQQKKWLRKPTAIPASDFEQLSLADHSVDLIFANLAFTSINSVSNVFTELHRVLKPDGLLCFAMFGPDTFIELKKSAFMDMHDIGDLLMKARYTDPVMDMEKLTLQYSNPGQWYADIEVLRAKHLTQALTSTFSPQLTVEAIYGHAWGSIKQQRANEQGEVHIPLQSIKKPKAPH